MSKYFFKTNINCLGCASQIKPHLDKLEQEGQIEHWQVHLREPDHTLEIESSNLDAEGIKAYIHTVGFRAESKSV